MEIVLVELNRPSDQGALVFGRVRNLRHHIVDEVRSLQFVDLVAALKHLLCTFEWREATLEETRASLVGQLGGEAVELIKELGVGATDAVRGLQVMILGREKEG